MVVVGFYSNERERERGIVYRDRQTRRTRFGINNRHEEKTKDLALIIGMREKQKIWHEELT